MVKIFPAGCCVKIIPIHGTQSVSEWYNSQRVKPLAAFNGSLYSVNKGVWTPAGIVFESGIHINGRGNALGIGYERNAPFQLAKAYDRKWEQFLSGYPLVCEGNIEPVPKIFYGDDKNLHLNSHTRLAVGQTREGRLMVLGSNGSMPLMSFKQYCYSAGAYTAINLDGGGSRHLINNGDTVYRSSRNTYNIIAVYPGDVQPDQTGGDHLKVRCTSKTDVYTAEGRKEFGRRIDKGDVCELSPQLQDNLVIPIVYPSGKTQRQAYVKSIEGFTPC